MVGKEGRERRGDGGGGGGNGGGSVKVETLHTRET